MQKVARSFGVFVALATILAAGCTFVQPKPPPKEIHAPFTLRPVGMDSTNFVRVADALIAKRAPRYRNHNAEVHLGFGLLNKYGVTDRNSDGHLYIVLGRPALVMATVEDLAMVLLHEYVHVIYWDYVYDNPAFEHATLECKKARAEMIANKVTVELYHTIRYRHDMLLHGIALYNRHYTYAKVMECPSEIIIDMPQYVRPLKPKGRSPVVQNLGLPDYVEDGRKDEYLEPWDDPNKTDPLYPYTRPKSTPQAPSDVE